jgi:hypothetical protein
MDISLLLAAEPSDPEFHLDESLNISEAAAEEKSNDHGSGVKQPSKKKKRKKKRAKCKVLQPYDPAPP